MFTIGWRSDAQQFCAIAQWTVTVNDRAVAIQARVIREAVEQGANAYGTPQLKDDKGTGYSCAEDCISRYDASSTSGHRTEGTESYYQACTDEIRLIFAQWTTWNREQTTYLTCPSI